jgi:hypothetical protein
MTLDEDKPETASDNYYGVSVSSGINADIQFDPPNAQVSELLSDCRDQYGKVLKYRKKSRAATYELLKMVYVLVLANWDRFDEMKELAEENELSFNAEADLFLLILKIVCDVKDSKSKTHYGHANVLRYMHHERIDADDFVKKLKNFGGIKKCDKLMVELGKKRNTTAVKKLKIPSALKNDWEVQSLESDTIFIEFPKSALGKDSLITILKDYKKTSLFELLDGPNKRSLKARRIRSKK